MTTKSKQQTCLQTTRDEKGHLVLYTLTTEWGLGRMPSGGESGRATVQAPDSLKLGDGEEFNERTDHNMREGKYSGMGCTGASDRAGTP